MSGGAYYIWLLGAACKEDSVKKSANWIVVAALAVFSTTAQGKDIVGEQVPDAPLRAAWNALGEKSLADFEGKVILLELFATW